MTDNEKSGNSNLIIFGLGIVAIFFAYLIYIKSKETQSPPQLQPIQFQPTTQPTTQSIDSVELYKISEQLKLQNIQIQSIQAQQIQQMQNINQIESTKCSNVVSMNDGTYPSLNNLSKISSKTNVRRENEEEIANRIFGMK